MVKRVETGTVETACVSCKLKKCLSQISKHILESIRCSSFNCWIYFTCTL